MKRLLILLMTVLLLVSVSYSSEENQKLFIAVMDLELAAGVPESYNVILSNRLRQELHKTGKFSVVERNDMEGILAEQSLAMSGCLSNECVVQVGKLLGVESMIAGSLGKIGQMHTITVRMIDVETGEILAAESVDCNCPIETVLTTSLRDVANMLGGKDIEPQYPKVPETIYGTTDTFPVDTTTYTSSTDQFEEEPTPSSTEETVIPTSTYKPRKKSSVGVGLLFGRSTATYEYYTGEEKEQAGINLGLVIEIPMSRSFSSRAGLHVAAFTPLEEATDFLYAPPGSGLETKTEFLDVVFDFDAVWTMFGGVYLLSGLGLHTYDLQYDFGSLGNDDLAVEMAAEYSIKNKTFAGFNFGVGVKLGNSFSMDIRSSKVKDITHFKFNMTLFVAPPKHG